MGVKEFAENVNDVLYAYSTNGGVRVAADANGRPHVVWADTRGRLGEQDIYYAKFGDFDEDEEPWSGPR